MKCPNCEKKVAKETALCECGFDIEKYLRETTDLSFPLKRYDRYQIVSVIGLIILVVMLLKFGLAWIVVNFLDFKF